MSPEAEALTAYGTRCELCQYPIKDVRAVGVYQFVEGWVMNRADGGAHGVSLPDRKRRWAHRECVESTARGTFRQAGLFQGT